MNLPTSKIISLSVLALAMFLTVSCEDSSTGVEPETQLEVHLVEDLPANANTERGAAPDFTFYSLREGSVVTDSASTQWDIAFSDLSIIINNGTSGPGNGGAVMLDMAFEQVETAPQSGYQTDSADGHAIDGWYRYTGRDGNPAHAVIPIENKTIVLKTADGNHYAKLEIISYYKGNPDVTTSKFANTDTRAADRYYTFRYVIQMDGSRKLK